MSQHNRRPHLQTRNKIEVLISGSIVNRKDEPKTKKNLSPEQIAGLSADQLRALLIEEIDEKLEEQEEVENTESGFSDEEQQLKVMIEAREEITKHIENQPRVGFTANPEQVSLQKEMLRELDRGIEVLKILSVEKLSHQLDDARKKMFSSVSVGFTSNTREALELKEYVRELQGRLEFLVGPPEPPKFLA
jgi:flagellar biosynthesis chaperone FliJ